MIQAREAFPTITLGGLRLATPFFLSPLAGYTNLPMRLVAREIGGVGLCTTDLVNARSLIEKNHKALKLIETRPEDSPMAVQLFGAVPDEMVEAARLCQAHGAASVDINMGCPVRKVVGIGAGSSMMTEYTKTAGLVARMVEAVAIPVTAKMRLGWDEHSITAPDLAAALEDAGVAAVFVHGRTRAQGFEGRVSLPGIARVVEAVRRIPVIGNGDVTTPEAAAKMMEATGCTGIGIGRGAFYNPWIFRHCVEYLQSGHLPPEPSFEERMRVVERHLDLMVEIFGENMGCTMFRKIGPYYSKRFGPSSFFNKRIVRLETRGQFDQIADEYRQWREQFLDDCGELLPRYQPATMDPNFLEEEHRAQPSIANRTAIPVPRGPNELW